MRKTGLAGDDAGLVTIYCDKGSAYLQFWRSVLERRAPRSLPAVETALGAQVRQGKWLAGMLLVRGTLTRPW